jgi:hypothetical protein
MPFYETVYETGRMSVAEYQDDDEAKSAIGEHHRRAVMGEVGGPIGQPAERIVAVFVYGEHPNEYNPDQTMSADVLEKELAALVKKVKDKNGVVAVDQFVTEVRDLTYPMVPTDDL